MKKGYTDITILLDRSGSMETIKSDMIGGFNHFRDEQKKVEGKLTVTLYQFDNWNTYTLSGVCLEKVYENKDISEVPDLELIPRGTTPLIDATCKSIREVGNRYSEMKEEDKPEKVIFVIITDGLENASMENSREILKKLIEEQTEKYNWQFVYLGANQDTFTEAASYGISRGQTMSYAPTSDSVKTMYHNLSSAITRSRTSDDDDNGYLEFSAEEQYADKE